MEKSVQGDAMVAGGRGWVETARTYVAGSGLKAETDEACHDLWGAFSGSWIEEFWVVRMIEDSNHQFLGGTRFPGVVAPSEPRHVRCGQSLASGRGCVKQRPNQPNSAA